MFIYKFHYFYTYYSKKIKYTLKVLNEKWIKGMMNFNRLKLFKMIFKRIEIIKKVKKVEMIIIWNIVYAITLKVVLVS